MTKALLNNRYQIIEVLGKGGFGETFLAIDTYMPSGRKCVIKQLKPAIQVTTIPEWLQERFKREAAILEQLGENHPQIPRLYAYFSEKGDFYLVQEWIKGTTLTQKHQQQGNFSEQQVRRILCDLLPVLDYIHTHRIIHRDLKPDNIIWRETDSKPVLIDFGVMKEAVATMINSDGKTAYSVILGTPGYMSSEQAAGRPLYSSDLYSLGLTAVFLLTGKTPQYLETDASTGEFLWRQDLPNLHPNLAMVIDRAIRFHPRDRFASAKEMLAALQVQSYSMTPETVAVAHQQTLVNEETFPQPIEPRKEPIIASPTKKEIPWTQWILGGLLFIGVTAGAFAVGFNAFFLKSPSSEKNEPSPQTFPPLTPSPEPIKTPSPEPDTVTTPEPEATTTPEPQQTITPEPEATTPPEPEVTPTPEPEETTTPEPEAEATPEEPTSEPEETTTPEPEAEATPEEPTSESEETTPEAEPEASPSPTEESSPNELPSDMIPTPESKNLPTKEVPTFGTGTLEQDIIAALGQPTSVKKGAWGNSRAVLYKNVVPSQVDLGYIFDANTAILKQTEVSFAQSVDLGTMNKSLNNLLGGKTTASIEQALEQVYHRQIDRHSFSVGTLKGVIQRNQSDRIYLGIWEADFH